MDDFKPSIIYQPAGKFLEGTRPKTSHQVIVHIQQGGIIKIPIVPCGWNVNFSPQFKNFQISGLCPLKLPDFDISIFPP